MSNPTTKAPDDPGAFGILSPQQTRLIDGAAYFALARLDQNRRTAADWHDGIFQKIHRDIFETAFPEHAGRPRLVDVTYRCDSLWVPAYERAIVFDEIAG